MRTAEIEKPVSGKQDSSPSLKITAHEKRAASISRLREAFSLHPTTEVKSWGPETPELRQNYPSQKRGVSSSCPSNLISPRGLCGSQDKVVSPKESPDDCMDRVELEKDSGLNNTSASSEDWLSTPEVASNFSSDYAVSSPEYRSSQENMDCPPSGTGHHLKQEGTVLPPPSPLSSSNAKRVKTEERPLNTGTLPKLLDAQNTSAAQVDVAVKIHKKIVPLDFSMSSLANRVRRLQQQKQRNESEQSYRKFRAKICPGENQAAEDELRKEIRYCLFLMMFW